MTLVELFNTGKYNTDKGDEHTYLPIYDRLFAPFKNKNITLLEVGYKHGGSCSLWVDYFPNGQIIAIENWKLIKRNIDEHPRIQVIEIDKADLNSELFKQHIDIAIDDGNHKVDSQIKFVKDIYPIIKKGGLLVIEDVEDIDRDKKKFDSLNISYEIIDNRKIKDRHDDVLLIFQK